MQAHALDNSPQSNKWTDRSSPTAPVINSLPCRPLPACLRYPLDKSPVRPTKTLLFLFKWTNLALAWEPQSTPPTYANKGMCPSSCLSHCQHCDMTLTFPYGLSQHAMYFLKDMWAINISIPLCLVICHWTTDHYPRLCTSLINCLKS